MTTGIRTTLTFLLALLLAAGGCSSWGGKINNTEGVNYYANGQYDQALTAYQTDSRLNPEDPEIYYNIASTYQQQALRYQDPSLLTQAETNYRICLQKNPTRETTVCCYRGLATVLNQRKDEKQALKVLQEWEEKEPTAVEPKLEIAYLLEAQGKNQEAADALTKIKDWAPNDYRAFYKLGLVEEKLGNNAEALEQLRAAARLNPANQDITNKITQLEGKESAPTVAPAAENTQAAAPPAPTASPSFASQPEPVTNAARTSSVQNDPANTWTSVPAQDGAPPAPGTGEPVFNAPETPGSSLDDLPGQAPSYDSPAPGALPASDPGTVPSAPPASADETDSLFNSGPADLSSAAPAPNAANTAAAQNAAGGISLPDGTGGSAVKLAYTGTPAPAAAAVAAETATPAASNVSSRKSSVGNPNPGPPRTSVGAPF